MQKSHLKVRYFHLHLLDYTIFLLKFLLNDMLILTTNNSLHVLVDCHTLFVDGTFKATPRIYQQLWTINGQYQGYYCDTSVCFTRR